MKNILLIGLLFFISQIVLAQKTPSTLAKKQAKPRTAINQWEKKLEAAKTDTAKIRICIDAADYYLELKENETYNIANYFLQKGLSINNKIGTNKLTPSLFLRFGLGAWYKMDYDKAEFYFKQMQQFALQQHDTTSHQKATFNLISVSKARGFYPSAIKQYFTFDRMQNNKFRQDSTVMRILFYNMLDCYRNLGDKQKTYFYLQKLIAYSKTPLDSLSMFNEKYFYSSEFNNHIDLNACLNIIRLSEKLNRLHYKTLLIANLSDYYIRQKQYDKAIAIAQSAIKMAKNKPEHVVSVLLSYQNISEAYEGKKQYKKALQYQMKMTDYLEKDTRLKYISYKHLVNIYVHLGNYKKAYEYSNKIAIHEEEVIGSRNKQAVAEIDAENAAMEKQAQLAKSELNAKVQQARIETEQQQKTIVFSLLLLSLGLLLWALWSYNKQRQLKNSLQIQNQKLEDKTQALEVKTQELSEANQVKDKIFAVIGHDIQSPVSDLSAITSLFESKDIAPEDVLSLMSPLTVKIKSLQSMLNNLLHWALLELKHQNNNKSLISFKHITEKVIQQLRPNADNKNIDMAINLQDYEMKANADEIEIAIRNIVSNSIKFTPKNGHISLESTINDQQFELKIKDSGVGIADEIHQNPYPISKLGTAGEKGLGLGLRVSKELIKKNGGSIFINSANQNGTTVSFVFNL